MEEILASIRRIISEDGTPAPAAAAPAPAQSAPSPATASPGNVLDLTQAVKEDGTIVDLKNARPQPAPAPPPPQQSAPPPSAPRIEPKVSASNPMVQDESNLMSQPVAAAATDVLTGLASAVSAARGLPMGANRTLEDVVKELLRPMLRQWLDANLPHLVQRIVEREVAKLTGRADDVMPR